MRNSIRDFFYFPKGDRRAVIALGCIAVFCIGVIVVVDALKGRADVASVAVEQRDSVHMSTLPIGKEEVADGGVSLRPFDPNTVDSATLVLFGIRSWKVRNFLHYRAAGKVFRSAEEMGKTYGWTEEDVAVLAPYVRISEEVMPTKRYVSSNTPSSHPSSSKFKTLTKVDINMADSATLCSIPGIGAGISTAILRYRARLGGFHSVQQLLEIDIFSSELLEWFTISDAPPVEKLPINKASFQTLNSHPYITYDQARNLLKYIRLYGHVNDEQSLMSTGIFTAEDMERLRPYILY